MTITTTEPAIATAPRRRMARARRGTTTSVSIAGSDFYLITGLHQDGSLGEVFIKFGKQGSTLSGLLDGVSIALSIGLQSGVPLSTFVAKYMNMRFEPMGMTDDPEVATTTSVLDYCVRRLALDFLSPEECAQLGIHQPDQQALRLAKTAG